MDMAQAVPVRRSLATQTSTKARGPVRPRGISPQPSIKGMGPSTLFLTRVNLMSLGFYFGELNANKRVRSAIIHNAYELINKTIRRAMRLTCTFRKRNADYEPLPAC